MQHFWVKLFFLSASLWLVSCGGAKKVAKNEPHIPAKVSSKVKLRNAIVAYARTFEGVPYKYGGNSPKEGFDCSGYVKFVFSKFDVKVPRVTKDYVNHGKRIGLNKVQLGDLILFSLYDNKGTVGHIGIISKIDGARIWFLHAASGKKSRRVMESELVGVHLNRMLFITDVL